TSLRHNGTEDPKQPHAISPQSFMRGTSSEDTHTPTTAIFIPNSQGTDPLFVTESGEHSPPIVKEQR
ncbi:hypothetical protein P7K49_026188, partial [Saguinus oedipus]